MSDNDDFHIGDRVTFTTQAAGRDPLTHAGSIAEIRGRKILVKFDQGHEAWLHEDEVRDA